MGMKIRRRAGQLDRRRAGLAELQGIKPVARIGMGHRRAAIGGRDDDRVMGGIDFEIFRPLKSGRSRGRCPAKRRRCMVKAPAIHSQRTAKNTASASDHRQPGQAGFGQGRLVPRSLRRLGPRRIASRASRA